MEKGWRPRASSLLVQREWKVEDSPGTVTEWSLPKEGCFAQVHNPALSISAQEHTLSCSQENSQSFTKYPPLPGSSHHTCPSPHSSSMSFSCPGPRGILLVRLPPPVTTVFPWPEASLLNLHPDHRQPHLLPS